MSQSAASQRIQELERELQGRASSERKLSSHIDDLQANNEELTSQLNASENSLALLEEVVEETAAKEQSAKQRTAPNTGTVRNWLRII